jgi:hypothetical protein
VAVLRAVTVVVLVLVVAAIVVLALNRPRTRNARIAVMCAGVTLASNAEFQLPFLRSATLHGYEGRLERVTKMTRARGKERRDGIALKSSAVQLRWDPATAALDHPSIHVRLPTGKNPGTLVARVRDSVDLRAVPADGGMAMQILSRSSGDSAISITADDLELPELNRVILRDADDRLLAADAPLVASNDRHQMVSATFNSLDARSGEGRATATLEFDTGDSAALFRKDSQAVIQIRDRDVLLTDCAAASILLDNVDNTEAPSAATVDVQIAARTVDVGYITLVGARGKSSGSAISVGLSGSVTSIKERGRELVPTVLGELLDTSPQRRGLLALAAGFVILVASTFVGRALSVIAEVVIPKLDSGGGK